MTDRLYYTDSYLREFDARVTERRDVEGRTGVVLDRTAFYPTSGGQPFDTGVIGSARVVDVVDQEDGAIVHVLEGGPIPSGTPVAARIDWDRRFEHMQQHTGQHVLSAAFDRACGARTLSFHLGSAAATIDLAREVSASEIQRAEDAANRVVWEDRPVSVRFVESHEAAALPLRRESTRAGQLRIVEIDGVDTSACGGTHVVRTGAVGVIAVSSWERLRGGSRVEFRCGIRALGAFRQLRDTAAAAAQLTSVAREELPLAIERLQAENRDARRRLRELEARLAVYQAESLGARASATSSGIRLVLDVLEDLDAAGLKAVAQTVTARPGHIAVLLGSATPVSVVVARSADVTFDAAALMKALSARFGGRGGGRPELAQGGSLSAEPRQVLAAARALIEEAFPTSAAAG